MSEKEERPENEAAEDRKEQAASYAAGGAETNEGEE
jgi:hypothetical protein